MFLRNLLKCSLLFAGFLLAFGDTAMAKTSEDWSIPVTNTINGAQVDGVWTPIAKNKITRPWHLCVLLPHLKDSYWMAVDYGVTSEASRDRATMQVYEAGGYGNLSTQLNQMDNCIAQRADAIVIGAISSDGVGGLVEKASKANIPVIDVSNGIKSQLVSAHALVSWYQAANALGKYIANSNKDKKVVVGWFPGPQGAGFSDDAVRGLADALKPATNVQVAVTRRGDTSLNVQLDMIQNALQAYPDINYLVGVDIAAEAAVVAARNANLTGKVQIASYVIIPPVYDAIARGTAEAAVTDFTAMQGRMAVDMAIRTLEHQPLPSTYSGPRLTIVTKDNINSIPREEMFAPVGFKAVFSVDGK
ncbi:TMAO reductase system periplasmic protein TorT [Caballeronia sp. LjRoot34]|uniref:TMAO reductase system periplasmic protein TorT n=1 Tax=Caballeronia sp. LjRoot34 TaxID=3342325 RepID=UPI003ECC9CB2